MIVSHFSLECEQCLEPFWHEGCSDFDLSLYSTADVRHLAKRDGWQRSGTKVGTSDICRFCVEENKAATKSLKKVVVMHG